MRVTSKGQVTIPQRVREELGITQHTDVDFQKMKNGGYRLVKISNKSATKSRLARLRGNATVRMSTDKIMALTRG